MVHQYQGHSRVRTRLRYGVGVLLVLLISRVLAYPGAFAAGVDTVSAIKGYYAALNSRNLDGTLTWFADTSVFTGADGQVIAANKAAWRDYVRTDLFPHNFQFAVQTIQAAETT